MHSSLLCLFRCIPAVVTSAWGSLPLLNPLRSKEIRSRPSTQANLHHKTALSLRYTCHLPLPHQLLVLSPPLAPILPLTIVPQKCLAPFPVMPSQGVLRGEEVFQLASKGEEAGDWSTTS